MKKEKGITLVAVATTVILMLILLGVTVNVSINKGGIVDKSRNAAEESRALEVEKAKELWLIEVQEEGEECKELKIFLSELQNQNLLTESEVKEIENNGYIEIGERTIDFSTYE